MRAIWAVPAALCLLASGCGGEEGVGQGATASIYAAASLCPGVKHEARKFDYRSGTVRVRVVCLSPARNGANLDMAAIGANARRAAEDSTTVGYIGEFTPAAARFSAPILDSAGIAQFPETTGAVATFHIFNLLEAARADHPASLREGVRRQICSEPIYRHKSFCNASSSSG